MAKDPAVLFYTSDFLSGVIDLDMAERGQYITLLCAQHQKGRLSEKTIWLLVGSCSVSVLGKFLRDENGLYYNQRMEKETQKRSQFVDSRKINGKKGGRPKQNHMDNHMDNHMENENDNSRIIENREGGMGEGYHNLETCSQIAQKDTRWMRANKATPYQLKVFNDYLYSTGEDCKTLLDYKRHFGHKKRKNPEMFNHKIDPEQLKKILYELDQKDAAQSA